MNLAGAFFLLIEKFLFLHSESGYKDSFLFCEPGLKYIQIRIKGLILFDSNEVLFN